MTEQLQKKVDRAIKLLQSAAMGGGRIVEIAYSGGKDSDVILELAKMADIPYKAIYRSTTIDPPGTIAHVKSVGAEIAKPKMTFRELIKRNGYPNRFMRLCCRQLKEYKIMDVSVMGIRRVESRARASNYKEPTECLFLGSKKNHVEAFYPILDWTDEDVVEFVTERGIKLHPLYYKEDGTIDPKRRLGCLCCPLQGHRMRINQFLKYKGMVRFYINAGKEYLKAHEKSYDDVYEWFYRAVFCNTRQEYEESKHTLFGKPDYKQLLEDYFNVKL